VENRSQKDISNVKIAVVSEMCFHSQGYQPEGDPERKLPNPPKGGTGQSDGFWKRVDMNKIQCELHGAVETKGCPKCQDRIYRDIVDLVDDCIEVGEFDTATEAHLASIKSKAMKGIKQYE